jgi:preprotein translocase subunit YajC
MARKNGKKIMGLPKNAVYAILIAVVAFVGFYVYRKRSQRQAMRARAFQRAMLARSR